MVSATVSSLCVPICIIAASVLPLVPFSHWNFFGGLIIWEFDDGPFGPKLKHKHIYVCHGC